MFASGVLFVAMGALALPLGIYMLMSASKTSAKFEKDKKKTRAKKKGKKSGKERDKDQAGKERGTSGGGSLLVVGILAISLGSYFLFRHFNPS